MRIFERAALIALLLAPLVAPAADLTFQIDGKVEYDDNAFRTSSDEDDDVLFRIRPAVKLHDDRGEDLRYSLQYAIPFEFAVDNGDELDDIDHAVRGEATYRANERLEFFVKDHFRYLRSGLRDISLEDTLISDGTVLVNQNRDRVTINDAEAGLTYRFTPRLSGSLVATHEFFDPDRRDRAENWLLSGVGNVNYILTPRHTVGLGGRYIRQEFEDRSNIPGSTANSYNAFAQWTFRYDDTLSFSVAAGPTVIDVDQDDTDATRSVAQIPFEFAPAGVPVGNFPLLIDPDGSSPLDSPTDLIPAGSIVVSNAAGCGSVSSFLVFEEGQGALRCATGNFAPPILLDPLDDQLLIDAATMTQTITDPAPDSADETTVDFFAEAVISKRWTENFQSALRYRRTQGGASGLGGSVIRDTVNFSNTWDIAERWQLNVRGDWSLRQDVTGDQVSQFVAVCTDSTDPSCTAIAGFPNLPPASPVVFPAGTLRLVTVEGGGSNEIDTMRYGVAGRLTYRFTRNTSSWVQLTYNEQDSDSNSLGSDSDFENFLAVLGVRHVFDPIKLW